MNFLAMMSESGRRYSAGAVDLMRPESITSMPRARSRCRTPGMRIRSGGRGRGLARGRGRGPMGVPYGEKF